MTEETTGDTIRFKIDKLGWSPDLTASKNQVDPNQDCKCLMHNYVKRWIMVLWQKVNEMTQERWPCWSCTRRSRCRWLDQSRCCTAAHTNHNRGWERKYFVQVFTQPTSKFTQTALKTAVPSSKLPARILSIWDASAYNQSVSRATWISATAFTHQFGHILAMQKVTT